MSKEQQNFSGLVPQNKKMGKLKTQDVCTSIFKDTSFLLSWVSLTNKIHIPATVLKKTLPNYIPIDS